MVRGVRGAITVESNTAEAIRTATRRLLSTIVGQNGIELEQIASVVFSATNDLDAETPAFGARADGLELDSPVLHAGDGGPGRTGQVYTGTDSRKYGQITG